MAENPGRVFRPLIEMPPAMRILAFYLLLLTSLTLLNMPTVGV
jgi:hypothetical protein